jgi:hypothetical protein
MQDEDNLHWQRATAAYTQKRGHQYTTSVGRIAASSSILSEYSFTTWYCCIYIEERAAIYHFGRKDSSKFFNLV